MIEDVYINRIIYIYREIYREIYMFGSSIGWSMNARASLAVAAGARFSTQD